MRRIVLFALTVGGAVLLWTFVVQADELTGSHNTFTSVHKHEPDVHKKDVDKKIIAEVSLGAANKGWYVHWKEAKLTGKADDKGNVKTEHNETRKLVHDDGTVKVWQTKPPNLGNPPDAQWPNNVHVPAEDKRAYSVGVGGDDMYGLIETGDDNDNPAVVVATSTITASGGDLVYTYSIDNQSQEQVTFSWPGVRTAAHPNGWSGTVAADSSVSITQTTPDTVDAYYIRSPVTSEGATFDGTFVTEALVSGSYLTFPPEVGALAGARMGPQITLTWTNTGAYDRIQVVRNGERIFEIDGTEQTYVDEEPEPGANSYDVIAIADYAGSEAMSVVVE